MASSLRDLRLWQESVALASDLVRAFPSTSGHVSLPLAHRILLGATGIAELIAEGHASAPTLERECYRSAKLQLSSLETQIAIAHHADRLAPKAYEILLDRVQLLHRLLAGYLIYLDRAIHGTTEMAADETSQAGASSALPCVYIVRRGSDASDLDVFTDYDLADEWARHNDSQVEEEPILDRAAIDAMKEEAPTPDDDLVGRLATEFTKVVRRELTPEQLKQVMLRNATHRVNGDHHICATHDFADANEFMAEAFRTVFARDIDLESDEDTSFWNRAWDVAKRADFDG